MSWLFGDKSPCKLSWGGGQVSVAFGSIHFYLLILC